MQYIFEFMVDYSNKEKRTRFENDLKKIEPNIYKIDWIDRFKVFIKSATDLDFNKIHKGLDEERQYDIAYPFIGYKI